MMIDDQRFSARCMKAEEFTRAQSVGAKSVITYPPRPAAAATFFTPIHYRVC